MTTKAKISFIRFPGAKRRDSSRCEASLCIAAADICEAKSSFVHSLVSRSNAYLRRVLHGYAKRSDVLLCKAKIFCSFAPELSVENPRAAKLAKP